VTACAVIVLRPEPSNVATVAAAQTLGLNAIATPMSWVEPVAWAAPPPERFDAILLGSANAVRHGGDGLANLTRLPVYAVGEVTAAAAREAGFTVVACGTGGIAELLSRLAADDRSRVLRLAGEEHVPIEPPIGMQVQTLVAYTVRPLPLSPEAVNASAQGAVVLLHSAVAAERFADQCDSLGIDRSTVSLACLGPRIAAAAGDGWRRVGVAPRPDDPALLALAARMCQSAEVGSTTT
jgi:uroporphyrinogen-III synthase